MRKEENFWEFCKAREKRILLRAEAWIVNSNTGKDQPLHNDTVQSKKPEGLNAHEIASLMLMHSFMQDTESSAKEVSLYLLGKTQLKNKSFQSTCLKTLKKYPDRYEWKKSHSKKELAGLDRVETEEISLLYTLDELKEHGPRLIVDRIAFEEHSNNVLSKKLP